MSQAVIQSLESIIVDLPTIRPHKLAMHTMNRQTLVILRLRCSDGIEGLGEATTIGGLAYGSESPESIKSNLDAHFAPLLLGQPADNVNAAMQRLDRHIRGNTFARSAVETALLDAHGKRLGLAVSELLGGRLHDSLEVAWTLASGDTGRDIEEAERMLDLALGERLVLHAARHHIHLAGAQMHRAVAEIDAQATGEDDEGLVGVGVAVPDEVAFDLHQLELVVVHLGDHPGLPAVVEQGELGGEVDRLGCAGGHRCAPVVGLWRQGRRLRSGRSWMIVQPG